MIHQHIQRAFLLLEQSRYDLAEQELRRAIAMDPDEARPYGLLAGCIVMTGNKERLHEVEEHARRAITLKPDWSYPHFVLGQAHLAAHRYRDAREEVDEAIRLDPDRADHFGLLAAIYLQTQRWQEAIEAAERGLAIEAQHETCTDLRSVALTKLGRREEAAGAIGEALRRNPQNADAHANQGWNMLHRGEYRQALEHFREALRIDPENQWARSGMVEALKARNPVYRVLLAWAFWLLKMDSRVRIAVIIGLYIVYRFMGVVAERNPSLAPFVQPFIILYITFAILTWVGEPLFDLMLRFSRFGRHALSRRQRLASTWFAALGSAAIVLLVMSSITGDAIYKLAALYCAILILPATHIYATFDPRQQQTRMLIAGGMALVAALSLAMALLEQESLFTTLNRIFLLSFIVFVFTGAVGGARRPTV